MTWIDRVQSRLARWRADDAGRTWVVAVSGGSDSVALLRLLHASAPALGLNLTAAHLNHGVRAEAARHDAEFVAALCRSLQIPFDLGQWKPSRPGHFEADARQARYAWLAGIAQARGASAIVIGHTRDDQAETILHRIVRGTGLRGLRGIPARRRLDVPGKPVLLRPLLSVSRLELRAYLEQLGQPYCEDASNANLAYTRVRLRMDLLPKLAEDYNPRVAEALIRLGEQASASLRAHRRPLANLLRRAIVSTTGDRIVLECEALRSSPGFLRVEVLRRAWRRARWPEAVMSARRWERLGSLANEPHPRIEVGAGVSASSDERRLVLERAIQAPLPLPVEGPAVVEIPGSLQWGGGRLVASLEPGEDRDETIDLECLVPPLVVRRPEPGDRFQPLGMDGRSTPLNDFFRGRGVPKDARARTPLLCDALGIVWVVGHRIADRVKLRDPSRRTLGLAWLPDDVT
ncbi:tRNA lysidine(34) synthetase TilS [Singulisphaera sp. PoT]|uniref:tRNA lysidine(34) synthetase TilS n=1 Tax=Singulisphaera sp. PoT TaxID=3411797 RepID=UPI003BF59B3E